jgi:hypothetical protein
MSIRDSLRTYGGYVASVIAIIVAVCIVYFYRSGGVADIPFIGQLTFSDIATINDVASFVAVAIITFIAVPILLILAARYVHRNFIRPAVGRHPIDSQTRQTLMKGLNGQMDFLAVRSCWPSHDPTARPANSSLRVDFGDAMLTTSRRDLATIQDFVTHPVRTNRIAEIEQSVLIINGEPGAGKSILTQELHASLARGIANENHSLIPIILYAADLCVDNFKPCEQPGAPFQEFLVKKLNLTNLSGDADLSSFVAANWNNYDFVVLVDGLDEIAQRDSYRAIQEKLKELIRTEIARSGQRARRFIMSCRTHDHLDVYPSSPSIELKGLVGSEERERFCDQLIKRRAKGEIESRTLRQELHPETTKLTSHDLFRRNPYFLTLLIEYHNDPNHTPIVRRATFEHIMNRYIEREAVRATRSYGAKGKGENSDSLFSSVYKISSLTLKYIAGLRSTDGTDNALYNKFEIDDAMVSAFGQAVSSCTSQSNEIWTMLSAFGASIEKSGTIDDSDISYLAAHGALSESDLIRIRSAINVADASWEDQIYAAFGTIPDYETLGGNEFYKRLATHIAKISNHAATSFVNRFWILLFARGIAGAHSLKLVYIDWANTAPEVSFRHRRLAEYFAACYFRDRWTETPWKHYSAWHTPIFNLVAAIEGERCFAFELVASHVTEQVPEQAYAWRSSVVEATEVAAFAERSGRFAEIVAQLLQRLATAMTQLTKKDQKKNDIASQFSIVNALGFMGDIGIKSAGKPNYLLGLMEAQIANLPAPFFGAKIKAANAIEQMTSRSRSLSFRLGSMWDLIDYPNGLMNRFASARNAGSGAELLLIRLLFAIAELALLAGFLFGGAKLVLLTISSDAPYESSSVLLAVLLPFGVLVAILRLLQWRTSPSTARIATMAITHPVAGAAVIVIAVWRALIALFRSFPTAMRQAIAGLIWLIKSVPRILQSLANFIRWLRQRWIELIVAIVMVCLFCGAVYGIILLGAATWQKVRIETAPARASQSAEPTQPVDHLDATGQPMQKRGTPAASKVCDPINAKVKDAIGAAQRGWNTASELAVMRRELAVLVAELTTRTDAIACVDWLRGQQTNSEAAYARLRTINRGAIPLPQRWKPTFAAGHFDELRRRLGEGVETIGAESMTGGWFDLSASTMFQNARDADRRADEIATLTNAMEAALQTGQITNLSNSSQLSDEQFLATFREAESLLGRSEMVRTKLKQNAKGYYGRAQSMFLRLLMVIGFFALAAFVLSKWYVERRDNGKIEEARKLSFLGIIDMIRTQNLSDRVRLKIVYLLREQPAGEEIAIAVEDLAQSLGATGKKRDANLSVELAQAAGFLSSRPRS